MPCEEEGGGQGHASTSQRAPKIAGLRREAWGGLLGNWLAFTLDLSPKLLEKRFLLFEATIFYVNLYGDTNPCY
jgi:hypothetical protein